MGEQRFHSTAGRIATASPCSALGAKAHQLHTGASVDTAAAEHTGGKADEIFDKLASHLVSNARIVPAGIVAVNRAQERGYTFASAG